MSVKIMSLIWDYECDKSQKLVLLKLADCGNDEGKSIYPSVSTIARQTCLSERHVKRILKDLKDNGIIKIEGSFDSKKHKSNNYSININALTLVTPCHHPSDTMSPPLVTPCHPNHNNETSYKYYYNSVLEIYNDVLGDVMPKIRELTQPRKNRIKNLINKKGEDCFISWFNEYCLYIKQKCPFLIGDNNRNWKANFDWIIKPENMVKIEEGNYEQRNNNSSGKSKNCFFDGFKQAIDRI